MTETTPEFRPVWKGFHRRLWRRWALLFPLTILILFIASGDQLGFAFLAIGMPMVVGGLIASLYFGRARVWFEGTTLRVRGALRTRAWSTADIARLVFVPQPGTLPGRPAPATLYAVTALDERLFWLSADVWEKAQLEEIAERVGAPVHHVPTGLMPKEINERFPGTIGWTALRPWLFAIVVSAGAFLTFTVFSIVTVAIMLASGQLSLPSVG